MMPLLVKTKRDHGHFGENDFMYSGPARRSLSNDLKQNKMCLLYREDLYIGSYSREIELSLFFVRIEYRWTIRRLYHP